MERAVCLEGGSRKRLTIFKAQTAAPLRSGRAPNAGAAAGRARSGAIDCASIAPLSVHNLAAALRDQPRGALVARVDPEPAQGDAEPMAQADQKVDVRDAPDPPGEGAAELDRSEIDHRQPLADLR